MIHDLKRQGLGVAAIARKVGLDRKTMRWGSTRTGVQRMRCVSCRRTFSSTTGTAVARIHSPARFHQVVADMFADHPRSCRRLGGALGLDKMTIWRWRRKITRALSGSGARDLGGAVEADEKFFRESRKGFARTGQASARSDQSSQA